MFVSVSLDFNGSWWVGGRDEFWRSFESHHLKKESHDDEESIHPERAADYERKFKQRFPGVLETLVNDEIERVWSERTEGRKTGKTPKVRIRLLTVEYGSIKSILDIVGIDNSDLRSFVIMALEIYSPLAFREALNTDVSMRAHAETLGGQPPIDAGSVGSSGRAAILDQALLRSVTSMLIPLGLAFVICFIIFGALMHEMDAVRTEAAAVAVERTEIVRAIVDQNKSISTSLVDYTKSSIAKTDTLEELLVALMKGKLVDINADPAPKKSLP